LNRTFPRRAKPVFLLLSASVFVPLVAACSSGGDEDDPNNRRTLRIGMIYGSADSESYIRQQYTDMFEFSHPNLDIELVNAIDYSDVRFATEEEQKQFNAQDPVEKVKAIMTGPNPVDVLMLDIGTMVQLAKQNLLKPLDPLIKEDKIDLEAYLPNVLDSIREAGEGQIYGLSPTFSSSALFYNKKLFQKAGVTPPTDGMTWDDVFNLAERMKSGSGKDAIFGLALNDWNSSLDFYSVQNIAAPLNLRMYDEKAEKMTVDTDQWEAVWKRPIELYRNHVIPGPEDLQPEQSDKPYNYNPYDYRPFFSNRVAMAIGSYGMVTDLATYNANVGKIEGAQPIDWDVVTYPVQAQAPGISGNMYVNQLTSINAAAANPDDAWEFIKFMNGKESAKFKSRSTYELSTLKEFIKPKDGQSFHIEAFYQLKPLTPSASDNDQKLYRERPNLNLIQNIGMASFQKALDGKLSVREALAEWQKNGNELLPKIKANPTGNIDIGSYMYPGGMAGEQGPIARAAAG